MNNLSISTPAIRLEAVNQNIVALRAQLAELEALRDQIQAEIPAEPQSRTIYTRAQVDQMLRDNDAAVEQAIIKLFQLQTAGEQMSAGTHCHNDVGFNAADARAGTRFARWLLGMNDRNVVKYPRKSLNHYKANRIFARYCQNGGTVMDRARKIALKHSAQLVRIANS